jgi:hypothetical protein
MFASIIRLQQLTLSLVYQAGSQAAMRQQQMNLTEGQRERDNMVSKFLQIPLHICVFFLLLPRALCSGTSLALKLAFLSCIMALLVSSCSDQIKTISPASQKKKTISPRIKSYRFRCPVVDIWQTFVNLFNLGSTCRRAAIVILMFDYICVGFILETSPF